MGIGTGLSHFENNFPDRYFDVGIAEPHALTFSAGLAAAGLKPFAAIYSNFLQRGYDNIVHDIALQNLPVKMFIDRAGLAVSDGATHHGIFDVAFLSHVPNIEILSPSSYESLKECVRYAYGVKNPIAVRYPNSGENEQVNAHFTGTNSVAGARFDFDHEDPPKSIYVTYGSIVDKVLKAKRLLESDGTGVGIVLLERIKPYQPAVDFLTGIISDSSHIVYVEEGIKCGGAGMITRDMLLEAGALSGAKFEIAAIDDEFANPKEPCDLYDYVGLSPKRLAAYFQK
jgi:1-deoxy-D-xylulose-5-phosphate synthase